MGKDGPDRIVVKPRWMMYVGIQNEGTRGRLGAGILAHYLMAK